MDGIRNQTTSKTARRRAFSLIELLVVISVVALLLSILLPSLRKARDTAVRISCASNLRQIGLGMNMYLDDNDNIYPCTDDPVFEDPAYWLWMGRGWRGWVIPYLGGTLDVDNPSVLLCPEDRTDPSLYESTSYAYSMAFYHSPDQIDTLNSSADTYSNPLPSRPQRVDGVAVPSGKILLGEWASSHARIDEEKGWWNWQGARNFLFADQHVVFLKATQILPARDDLPDANLTIHGIKGRDVAP